MDVAARVRSTSGPTAPRINSHDTVAAAIRSSELNRVNRTSIDLAGAITAECSTSSTNAHGVPSIGRVVASTVPCCACSYDAMPSVSVAVVLESAGALAGAAIGMPPIVLQNVPVSLRKYAAV